MRLALLAAALLCATPAFAQQETSTPSNPEQVPAQNAFDFGAATEPTLTCAQGKYCAIALETGETVQSAEVNNADDWSVTATVYGAGKLAKPVILISPGGPGLKDELTIQSVSAQQKSRTYKVKLVSDADQWTQLTTFRYPPGQ